jgi:hypothetical protein
VEVFEVSPGETGLPSGVPGKRRFLVEPAHAPVELGAPRAGHDREGKFCEDGSYRGLGCAVTVQFPWWTGGAQPAHEVSASPTKQQPIPIL